MNKSRILTLLILQLLLISEVVMSQEISIANISRTRSFYDTNIEISGSGFNATAANNEVWFGASKGTVVSSTPNLLIASVPGGATLSAVTVLNKSSGLSASSSKLFHEVYNGNTPDYSSPETLILGHTKELLDLAIADLDNDGKNDLIASKDDNTATKIITYRNTGTGSNIAFVVKEFSVGSPTSKVSVGDIDGDGKLDLVFARDGTSRNQIYVLRNTSTVGDINFAAPKSYYLRAGQFAKSIAIRDLNLDGKPEVVVANSADSEISIFVNQSNPGSVNLSTTPTRIQSGGATSNDLIVEDFDLDGKHDIAFTQFAEADIIIIPNRSSSGTLSFGDPITIAINGNLNEISAGDLNQDGKVDIAVTDPFGGNLSVVLNESSGSISFGSAQTFASGAGSASIAMADYTGNGLLDVFLTSSSENTFTVFANTSSSGTLNLTANQISQANRSLVVVAGDISNDSRPDIAFTAHDPTGTNNFLVTVRNTNCVNPTIIGDSNPTICSGQTYDFKTPPVKGGTFIWEKGGVEVKNSSDPFYSTNITGDYTVTVELDAGACSVTSAITTLADNPGAITDPTIINDGPTCVGSTITLTASDVGTGSTYAWAGPNGFTSTDRILTLSNVSAAMAGRYTVIAEISPCKSTPVSTFVEVINPPDLSVALSGPDNLCTSESVTLTVGSATGYTYQWFKDGTLIAGATNNSYAATAAGSYTVNLKSSDCDLTSTATTITTFSPPTPVFTASGTLCEGSTITFNETTVLEPGKVPTYSWDFGDMAGTSTDANPTYTYTTANTYSVKLTIGYEGHTCVSTATANDVIINAPTAFTIQSTGDIPFCEGDSVLLEVPATGFSSATWSTSETGLSIYGKVAGAITVTATNTAGCISTNNIDLTTNPAPVISITIDNEAVDSTTISIGQSAQLEASGADSYVWSPAEGLDNAAIANPIASPSVTTVYQVIGTGINGCSSVSEVTINIEDTGDKLPVEAPKMFSPNSDGIDDEWIIDNIENFPDCEIVIFSRNGKIVYQETGYNTPWRGIDLNGNDLPEGAYFYTISCPDGKATSGSVSIIR